MENDSQNLKIRVVMKPATTAGVSAQYRYNWARVALIAAPVILLLALAAKFLFDKPETAPESEVASTPAASSSAVAAAPAAAEEQDVLERARQLAANNALAQESQPAAPEEPAFSVEPSVPAATTPEEDAPPAAESTVATTAADSTHSATAATLQPGQTRTLSSKVKRFQLTSGITDREPRGNIKDIQPAPDGVLRIYVFSEVTDMKDDVIHYRWIRNGKQQANVKIGVWSNRWRSNSSKYIAADMHGDWQVRMENKSGELLAEASFRY